MDAKLQKQANFINQFGEGMIWKNVVIIAKQPGSFNLDQATQGAMEAAKLYCPKGRNKQPTLRSLISELME